ncbi:MAG: hypothetical protein WA441_00420 [Methyloceanibacter sp.]
MAAIATFVLAEKIAAAGDGSVTVRRGDLDESHACQLGDLLPRLAHADAVIFEEP